ncbi:MAG: hypothetical protein Q8K36_00845 [Alphaproteobacteria bacterium]|nr:hypothetical protein [Alphaproteobacteria bacterium]
MKILGLYTHLNRLHIYYASAEQIFENSTYTFEERALSHELPQLIAACFSQSTPECIALHNGPGAFTSLRVTLAFIQGFSTGLNIPLYVCDHFQLLQDAYQIHDGLLMIENKSQMLPAVRIENGVISDPFQYERASIHNHSHHTYPLENCSKNLAFTLYERARQTQDQWISHTELSPNYCFLPQYQKAKA